VSAVKGHPVDGRCSLPQALNQVHARVLMLQKGLPIRDPFQIAVRPA
jgi:hypothetical protein